MLYKVLSVVFACGGLSALPALPQATTKAVPTLQAEAYIGTRVKVCGVVVGVRTTG